MKEKLLAHIEGFKNTEPIFKIQTTSNGEILFLNPLNKIKPTPIPNDVLSQVACLMFEEKINIKNLSAGYKHDINYIFIKAINYIIEKMLLFIEHNLSNVKPKNTKLYRWLYKQSHLSSKNFIDGLILLYEYIKPFCDDNMHIIDPKNYKHANNAITILKALKAKYDS